MHVQAADYALPQFRGLLPLLLVHGLWNHARIGQLVMYSFYKNLLLVGTMFIFGFFNAFSGTTLYESWLYAVSGNVISGNVVSGNVILVEPKWTCEIVVSGSGSGSATGVERLLHVLPNRHRRSVRAAAVGRDRPRESEGIPPRMLPFPVGIAASHFAW